MSSTAPQTITPELRQWIVAQAEAGCRPDDVLAAMKASGWDEDVAIEAMEITLRQRLDELHPRPPDPLLPVQPGKPLPEPRLEGRTVLSLKDGHRVRVLTTMKHPRVVVFGGLLTDAECETLMSQAKPRLLRSETVQNETGGSEVNDSRTSDGMFFERGETPLIDRVEKRIAELLHWPLDHGEGLQVLRYRPGAEYKPHHDYFDPVHSGTPRILERGGQRVGTLVVYLNTPEGGGATTFPDVGLEVAPVRGNAVFFSYDRPHVSTKTLHGGAPVTAGEKWVATKWLREGVFV
ncbi:2OG-Fe(II) oxygenase [Rubrivivax rivuli]|uniref:2-oxoglutarate-dependent dioxygenase n=1 Tax=Rubrivivax rivuli TaxID=1862385 RepID=A0A437R8J0_9BURK|nr:2OG-Fe(II) oxygenase [Rubrivivax rivuli]RVU43053.1 2-oxoglutarate-dependent dioxygenase [Rubrivivax rivuli]